MKTSDYIWNFLIEKGVDTVFMVAGGAAAHLMNSLNKQRNKIKIVCCYHEQACAMAADGYYRIAGKPAVVLVTNGPGSTNAITGVLSAYQDSIPIFIISGQVPTNQTLQWIEDDIRLRQFGVQECNIEKIVKSIVKYVHQLDNNSYIKEEIQESYEIMMEDRMGPVWIDIPLDIQNKELEIKKSKHRRKPKLVPIYNGSHLDKIVEKILQAKRPLIIAGNGIHLSKTEKLFNELIKTTLIPVVTTWNAKDLMDYNDPLFVGSFGILGERAGNFAVQNADLILVLGSRLSIPCIGYNFENFAPKAIKILVDIDINEMVKPSLENKLIFEGDLRMFLPELIDKLNSFKEIKNWRDKVQLWKQKYPIYQQEYAESTNGINSFYFIETLSKHLKDNHVIVTDMGTAFTCTMQAMKMNGKARMFTSSGTSAMGYGLPGAIGAWFADPTKEIILIAGDGGFQMNIQELQTVAHHKIPLKIFILNNRGYSAISLMQDNLFNGEYIGSEEKDISYPNFTGIAKAYRIDYDFITNSDNVDIIGYFLPKAYPIIIEVIIPENQPLYPRVQSQKKEDGDIISNSLENMFPYLSKEEMEEIMSN